MRQPTGCETGSGLSDGTKSRGPRAEPGRRAWKGLFPFLECQPLSARVRVPVCLHVHACVCVSGGVPCMSLASELPCFFFGKK